MGKSVNVMIHICLETMGKSVNVMIHICLDKPSVEASLLIYKITLSINRRFIFRLLLMIILTIYKGLLLMLVIFTLAYLPLI
jgi:hypothetical protein